MGYISMKNICYNSTPSELFSYMK